MNKIKNQGIKIVKSTLKKALPNSIVKKIREKKKRVKTKIKFNQNLRQTDVFLVGHPKSGNTWLAYMLGIILHGEQNSKVNLGNINQFVPNIHSHDEQIAEFDHLKSTRIFRSESPLFADKYPKTIYIIRDPRAVLLSYYHHSLHARNLEHISLDEFVEEILTYGCIRNWEPRLIRWDIQVREWLARANNQPVKIVRYEDLVADRKKTLKSIIDFAEIKSEEDLFTFAVDRGDFNNMRGDEKKHGAESYPGENGSKGFFVRKGKIDSWKEEMPQNVINKIENKFQAVMKSLGYLP